MKPTLFRLGLLLVFLLPSLAPASRDFTLDPLCTIQIGGTDHQIIYRDGKTNRRILLSHQFERGAREILGSVVYGTTGPRYRHVDGSERAGIGAGVPYLFTLTIDRKVMGTFALYRKIAWINGRPVDVFYRTSLAVHPEAQGLGIGKFFTEQVYNYALSQIEGEGLLYGYVESDNERSLRMAAHNGAYSIGEFSIYMYRPTGKAIHPPTFMKPDERVEIINGLKKRHAQLTLKDFAHSLDPVNYFVARGNGGEILAGVQTLRHHWAFESLPGGPVGALVKNIFPHLPWVRTHILNPRDHQFVQFGNFYWADGQEQTLINLMNGVLDIAHVTSGLVFVDERSEIYRLLNAQGAFGGLSRALKSTAKVMVRGKNLRGDTLEALLRGPLHISIGDQ